MFKIHENSEFIFRENMTEVKLAHDWLNIEYRAILQMAPEFFNTALNRKIPTGEVEISNFF